MNPLYVFEHGDPVLIATFLLLIAMSAASWYIILWKAWKCRREKSRLAQFRKRYVTTPDWPRHTQSQAESGCIALLLHDYRETCPVLKAYPAEERKEILGMHLAQTLDTIRTWMDRGLTALASIGSSAPFIGLFGTVWGVYGALGRIALEGNAGLDVVAGPMGEALVATAAGLFAAIPAVLAYNAFVRGNRLLMEDMRHIAEQLTTYAPYAQESQPAPVKLVSGG